MSRYDEMVENRKSLLTYYKKAKHNGFLPAFYSFDDYLVSELMQVNYFNKKKTQHKLLDFYGDK